MKRMKPKKACILFVMSGLIFLLGSCAPTLQPNAEVRFHVPATLSVIEKDSKIGIMSLGNNQYGYPNTQALLKTLTAQINKAGYFKATAISKLQPGMNFTHLMNIDNFMVCRRDTDQQTRYNRKYGVIKKETRDSKGNVIEVSEQIGFEDARSAAATMITAVTIYRVSNLEPLIYFNVISNADDWKPLSASLEASESQFEKALSRRIIDKIKEDTSAERKKTGVILPDSGDQEAKRLILDDRSSAAIQRLKPLLPDQEVFDLSPNEVREWYEKESRKTEEAGKAGNKDNTKRELERDLANFYLYAIANETLEVKPATLQSAFRRYSWILSLTESDSLITACAHSLGRVETFAGRINPAMLQNVVIGPPPSSGQQPAQPIPKPREEASDAPHSDDQEVLIGEVGQGQTIGGVLLRHKRSKSKVNAIIKKFTEMNPEQDLRRVRVGTKVFLSGDDQMRLDPPPMKRR
jgi:hypothetical protein